MTDHAQKHRFATAGEVAGHRHVGRRRGQGRREMSSPYIIRIVIHAPDTRTLESHDMINGDDFDDVPAEIRKILTERTEHVMAMIADHCADEDNDADGKESE